MIGKGFIFIFASYLTEAGTVIFLYWHSISAYREPLGHILDRWKDECLIFTTACKILEGEDKALAKETIEHAKGIWLNHEPVMSKIKLHFGYHTCLGEVSKEDRVAAPFCVWWGLPGGFLFCFCLVCVCMCMCGVYIHMWVSVTCVCA